MTGLLLDRRASSASGAGRTVLDLLERATARPGGGVYVGSLVAEASPPPCTPPCPTLRPDLSSAAADLVRLHRAGMTLRVPTMVLDPLLQAESEWKVLNMAGLEYMAHEDPVQIGLPNGRAPADRFLAFGYHAAWGENIAYGYPDAVSVVNAFLGDYGHRANIEGASWLGYGCAAAQASTGVIFWEEAFGANPVAGPPPPPPPPPPVPSGVVLHEWLTGVLPLIQGTPQYQKWAATTTGQTKADVIAWQAYLAHPTTFPPAMKTAYGKSLVADLHLAFVTG